MTASDLTAADVAAAMGRDIPGLILETEPRKPLLFATDEIDACTDIVRLRELAKQYRDAMIGQHDFAGHALEVENCAACWEAASNCDPYLACDQYKAWQAQYMAALGAPILGGGRG